jgi:hypothetical protein
MSPHAPGYTSFMDADAGDPNPPHAGTSAGARPAGNEPAADEMDEKGDEGVEAVKDAFDLFNAKEAIDPTDSSTGPVDDEAGPASEADAQPPG